MQSLARWVSQYVLPLGAAGLFLVALLDSGLIPMPQGVDLLLFAQVIHNPRGAFVYATVATLGSLLGSTFLYYVSRKAGEAALTRATHPERMFRIRRSLEKYEAFALVLPTMVPLPLPMKLMVIASGVFEVRLERFVAAILFARVVRYFGIALIAQRYGETTWAFIRQNAVLVGLGALLLVGGFYLLTRRVR